jgi:hypothetical protein
LEEFRTSIFEKTRERSTKRLFYNLGVFGSICALWVLYFFGFPLVGLKTAVTISIALLGMKIYDDKYMGITAYGERKDTIVISEQYLEIRGIRILYSELTNLVIYVDEYLGMPKEIYGIHHGGNNSIEFDRNGKSVLINYVIKNKQDFEKVNKLVNRIERNPDFKKNMRKL